MEERNEQEMMHEERMRKLAEKKMAIKEIMNSEDLASLFGISERMVVYYIQKGRIPSYKLGRGKYLISRESFLKHIESHSTYKKKV